MIPMITNSLQAVKEACAAPARLGAALESISCSAQNIVKNTQCNGVRLDEVFGKKGQ